VSKAAFSVVLPTYNRAHTIGCAIKSVQEQTLSDWELIVIDDGSTDETRAVVEDFMRRDLRIKLIANSGRVGPAGARNTGIRAAQGEMVAFLDSDDSWDRQKLEAFFITFHRNPDAVLVGSDYRITDDAQAPVVTMKSYLFDTILPWWQRHIPASAVIPADLIRDNIQLISEPTILLSMAIAGFLWIQTSSAIVRRDAALKIGLFNERLRRTEDIDLWLRLSQVGRVVYLDEVLATYDIRGRNNGTGLRYSSYHRSRRHSAYSEAAYHLRCLERIAKTHDLNADQWRLVEDRRIEHRQRCAVIGLRERKLSGIGHLFAWLASNGKRQQLLARVLARSSQGAKSR
jgi:glycosyltransferase involved in cell wall biosynthesis